MKVLWFEVTIPKNYGQHAFHGAGWQDSLEYIVKSCPEIELGVAFEGNGSSFENKIVDGVSYFPINPTYSAVEKIKDKFSWKTSRDKLIPLAVKVIEEFKPDVIHVFGSEWCFGQVAEFTDIPVIIHMQGSIPPYYNALYPPGYNEWTEWMYSISHLKLKALINLPIGWGKLKTWKAQEEKTLRLVKNYMGRTEWDKGIVRLYQPGANYFYCSEALRPTFINNAKCWQPTGNKKVRLVTTGVSSFWKGLDTIVRTAKLLKDRNFDFEWCLAGKIANKELIEWKEKIRMEDVNIRVMGMLNADDLLDLLLQTDIYVHSAYIDNSPNSICEAQYLGLPVIATYVGGIPSLVENGNDGLLVPANAPFTLANQIIKLANDTERQQRYAERSRTKARERHNPDSILNSLTEIYKAITKV